MQNARSAYYEGLSGSVKDRYDVKIMKCGGIDPYSIKDRDLSSDRKDFPDMTLLDIGNHLICSQSPFTKKQFKVHKSMNAYHYFESGFVLSLGAKKNNDNDLIILKGKVKHSQRMNDSPLRAWILANKDGEVHCAHCTCIAGLAETCSHIGALCFAILTINESSEAKSVTDVLCEWNVPKFKEVSMSAIKDIKWRTFKESVSSPNLDSSFVTYVNSLNFLDDETVTNFINSIHSDCEEPAIRTIMYPYDIRRTSNIRDEVFLASIYDKSNASKSRHELVEMGKSTPLLISDNEVKNIARITMPKKRSKFWIALKRERVTGSIFKDCCVSNIDSPSITTINRIMNPKNVSFVPGVRHQIKKKKKAIDVYVKQALTAHENFKYKEHGLIMNPIAPYFAASTDGLVSCDCHGSECIEIKCLMNMLETTFDGLTLKPNNILNKIGDEYFLEGKHELFFKIQMAINLSELKYCDLIILTPKNNPLVLKINADITFWNTTKQKALTFHEQVVMPELLGKLYTRITDLPNSIHQTDEEYSELEEEYLELEEEYLELDEEYLEFDDEYLNVEQGFFEVDEEDCQIEEENIEIENRNVEKANSEIGKEYLQLVGLDIKYQDLNPSKQEKTKNKDPTESKKKSDETRSSQHFSKDVGIKNLMNASIEEILATFAEHKIFLTELYGKQIKELKRNYRPMDVPDMIALDIVNITQFEQMVVFLERMLVSDFEKEHNSSDVIFDSIIPEWAILIFCKEFDFTRSEAVKYLKLRTALMNMSDSE